VDLLAYYGDVQTAAAVLTANPALANDPVALENAAGQGHEPFVRLMLRYQPELAARIAVGVRSEGPQGTVKSRELTELLFDYAMDPSRPDWLGITPLHQFARKGDVENAGIVLDHGADLDARDEDIRSTPLGWAAKFGRLRMVELLLERGAKPNLPDDPAWASPLKWPCVAGMSRSPSS
jgi:ankyrin repeat protein